jgi:hypothetical protein
MANDFFLRNRSTIAVITGGTQGLGLAISKRQAQEGAHGIVISGRNPGRGKEAAETVRSLGADCLFVEADISTAGDCRRLVETALNHFGSINGLVNSAATSDRGTLLDTSLELWDRRARSVPDNAGRCQTPSGNRQTGQHCQYSFNGRSLRPILFNGVLGVERSAGNTYKECRQRVCDQTYTVQRHPDWVDGYSRRECDSAEIPRCKRRLANAGRSGSAHGTSATRIEWPNEVLPILRI